MTGFPTQVSQAKYAELQGVSRKTVTLWKEDGYLSMAGKLVDVKASDKKLKSCELGRFRVTTKVTKKVARVTKSTAPKRTSTAVQKVTSHPPADHALASKARVANIPRDHTDSNDDDQPITKAQASLRKEFAIAQKHELDLKRIAGDLLDRKAVEKAQYEIAAEERDALLNWPAQVHAQMSVDLGIDAGLLAATLEKYVRTFLLNRSGGLADASTAVGEEGMG